MKTIRLFTVSLIAMLSCCRLSAQSQSADVSGQPAIYMVAVDASEVPYYHSVGEIVALNSLAADYAQEDFENTFRRGFQQVHPPQFIFSTRDNRFSLGIGGYVNLRASYDMKGAVGNIDFVPYDIPIEATYANRQRVMMDATTSRLFTKAVINSPTLGQVVAFVDMDFRGGKEFSYTPRLRSAYISMLGFTAGRDVSTFCDLEAAPITVDFQGPNAYNFNFATMLRYEANLIDNHLKLGIAAEMPEVSGTYGDNFAPISQRVPDIPMYVQYAWGADRQSHFRASAVLRNMYLHNADTERTTSLLGWGVQASGRIETCDYFTMFFNGVYGKGITPYIQDLTGSGLDFTPNPEDAYRIQTMPMWAWQVAGQVNIIPSKLFASGGYSVARVNKNHGYYAENEYKRGTYIFGNLFYQATDNCRLAIEYLHGSRTDMDTTRGEANRLSLMIQYNF
ncbi:MAG: porin [Alistipes sp.]|nr:porin [Alistipes sp.]